MEVDKSAGPELDKAVADVAGIAVHVRVLGVGVHEYRLGAVVGETDTPFRPSTDWNDAMEAAEKAGLLDFRSYPDAFVVECHGKDNWQAGCKDNDYYDGWQWCGDMCASAETGPLAICRAILKAKAVK